MSTTTPALDPKLSDALRAELVQTVQAETTAATILPLAARSRSRRKGIRLALVAASVTGLAIGASLLIPAQNAYAGWSATPRVIDGDPAQTALAECSAGFAGHYDSGVGPTTAEPTWSGGLVEQRGRWQLTLVRGDDGTVGMCMGTLPSDGSEIGGLSVPRPPAQASVTVVDNNGVFDHVSRDPRVINGWFGEPELEGHHYTSGVAGDLVSSIVLHTPHGDVTASLTDGLWAAWWPTSYPDRADSAGTGPTGATLTLTDGSTVSLDATQLEELHDLDS